MSEERRGVITFKGTPLTLIGPEIKVGDKAPDFRTVIFADGMQDVTLSTSAGKVRIFSVVPSLDTPVCDMQTRRFNQEATALGDDVVIYTVSVDLPFAANRWCGAAGVDRVVCVSDYQERSFGKAYGVLIKELKLLARSIFVVDSDDKVVHAQIVPEVSDPPNFDAALAAAKSAAGK